MSVLALVNVTKRFGSRLALNGFTLEVNEGERVGLLGPSGCGKTTALRLLAGLDVPDAGCVEVGGRIAAADGRLIVPPERRGLGKVFQDLALWPHMTVKDNMEFGLRALGVSKSERASRVNEMLQRVELLDYRDVGPAALSGGQQQRVALGRALVLQPRALLMDEPLSDLDVELNLRLREEILTFQRSLGFSLLYVTHDPDEAAALAQRTVTLGRLHA